MLQSLRRKPRRIQTAISKSIPPPVGGLNARDALAAMDPTDALVLDNFFPETSDVRVRKGYTSHATGMSGQIRSLFEYAGPASRKLFAAITTDIYDVTSGGAVGAAVVSTLTSGDWQTTMMANSGGNHLVICNGADAVRSYDGTTWASPAITGVTPSTLISPAVHKKRLWFVEKNTTNAWYLATEAIAGAATKFAVGAQFKKGGKLVAIATWTRDGGAGPDDYAVFISSMGELAIYAGTDPASAATWDQVGVFAVGAPIGDRCTLNIGSDMAVLTKEGVISLTAVMGGLVGGKAAITDKITKLFNAAALSYASNFGWQGIYYPNGNMALFNIPVSAGATQHQYVMNTLTGAWCRFTGMNAGCWSLLSDNLYFGGNSGVVYRADNGYQDNSGGITADMKTAFNYFGLRGLLKIFSMVRTIFSSSGTPAFLMDLNVDFENRAPTSALTQPSLASASAATWGVAVFDVDMWAGTTEITKTWQGVTGEGMCAAIYLRVQVNGESCEVNSFDVLFQRGGIV